VGLYLRPRGFATGKLLAEPVLATQRFTGANSCPEWSDDGRQLLFLSARKAGAWGTKAFCIRSTETGEVRELASKLHRVAQWVRWSPDGRSLLVLANIGGGFPICRIDVQTGDFEPVVEKALGWPAIWSRDSRSILYQRWNPDTKTTSLVRRELATGQDWVLQSVASSLLFGAGAALSRDGKHLAFVVGEMEESGTSALKLMPATGGEPRELLHADPLLIMGPSSGRPVLWLPDSQSLLFMRRSPSATRCPSYG
jgi:Tol biopolymer transport system component